jgi:23S rRNA (uracil1939-C5)-methyltransferase
MPLTEEVETLAVLVPGEVPAPEVLYRDEELLAVAKAPHEPTTPQGEHDGSLLHRVKRLGGAERATPVHRLDIGTSGIVLFALEPEHVRALSRALAEGEKEYVALVRGVVRDKGSIRRPLVERGRPLEARTRYVRKDIVGGHSFVVVRPDEGRKHQIRRHFAAIGHALVGDERYGHGPTNQHFGAKYFLDRSFLHCGRLAITHHGQPLELAAPLAPDLSYVLERLRKKGD